MEEAVPGFGDPQLRQNRQPGSFVVPHPAQASAIRSLRGSLAAPEKGSRQKTLSRNPPKA